MSKTEHVEVLLVEDDPGHARLIEKNLRRSNITNKITVIDNGNDALDYLFCKGAYGDRRSESPVLVLLDLNLPGLDGYEILRQLKAEESTRKIPVVILTTTSDQTEVERCYELGCNVFVSKPVEYKDFSEAIARLGLFLSVVAMPGGRER